MKNNLEIQLESGSENISASQNVVGIFFFLFWGGGRGILELRANNTVHRGWLST